MYNILKILVKEKKLQNPRPPGCCLEFLGVYGYNPTITEESKTLSIKEPVSGTCQVNTSKDSD